MRCSKVSCISSGASSRRRTRCRAWLAFLAVLVSFGHAAGSMAQSSHVGATTDEFEFSTRNATHYLPAFQGNGYLFTATPWNGTGPAEATIAGLYDHLMQGSYPYQALIPAWAGIDYWDGSRWLNTLLPGELEPGSYLQRLNIYHGLLLTRYAWVDTGHRTEIRVQTFVCRQNPHLGVVHIQITPHYGVEVGPITVAFSIGGPSTPFIWEGAKIPGSLPIHSVRADPDHRGFFVESATRDGQCRVAEAVRVALPPNLPEPYVSLDFSPNLKKPALNVKFIVRKDKTYSFTKFVAIVASHDEADPAGEAGKIARDAEQSGYAQTLRSHEAAWQRLWQTDIRIQGDREAERTVHAAMYYLFSALRRGVRWSVPAMALPSRAYLGRIWWDADTFILPSMLALHPALAQSIVTYRCRMLPSARLNAQRRGYRGALFPMESAGTGEGAAPEWGSEIHVTGDVAMAQWRYFEATGDLHWLAACGYPILHDVADFWVSRVTYYKKNGRYEIRHVTGPNEAIVDVDNDSYTNAIALRTLEVATEAARLLHKTPDPRWAQIASKILIPFDSQRQYHPEHSGDEQGRYAHALILLTYPLAIKFPDAVKRNDLDACLENFGKPGYQVGMLGNFYSIVASELGDRSLAWRLFTSMLHSYSHPPFDVMTETPSNGRGVFLTAEGAFLQQIIFGFTGLRFTAKGLAPVHPPELPAAWNSIELRNIMIRGKRFDVRVGRGKKISITPAGN